MTSEVMSADYGAFTLTGENATLAYMSIASGGVFTLVTTTPYGAWGAFSLTGGSIGASHLWLPIVQETANLSVAMTPALCCGLTEGYVFGASSTQNYAAGAAIVEALRLNDAVQFGAVFSQLVSDRAAIVESLALTLGASCGETLTFSQTTSLALAITVAQTLFLSDAVPNTLSFNLSMAEALLANTAFGDFFGVDVRELAGIAGSASPLWQFAAAAAEQVVLADVAAGLLLISITAPDGMEFVDADVLSYIFSQTIAEGVAITAGYVSPNGNFTAWAINTRTTGVTEYQNFAFDSFAQSGRKYLAGNAAGLYELDGDDDAGTPIVADLLSGFMEVGGSHFKAFKAAYLGIKSKSGQFVLKLITGDGETYVYTVVANDMRSTRVNMGKGLRARYFRFELINSDGADFDLHSIEFLPLVAQRRI